MGRSRPLDLGDALGRASVARIAGARTQNYVHNGRVFLGMDPGPKMA
jgi:hypothetical protein